MYLILMKWLWSPHVKKLGENIVGMSVRKIVQQKGKTNFKNQIKIVTLEKYLTMIPNWKHYGHPPIAPPNLGANLTSFKHHEPLFHTYHKLLHQIDED